MILPGQVVPEICCKQNNVQLSEHNKYKLSELCILFVQVMYIVYMEHFFLADHDPDMPVLHVTAKKAQVHSPPPPLLRGFFKFFCCSIDNRRNETNHISLENSWRPIHIM